MSVSISRWLVTLSLGCLVGMALPARGKDKAGALFKATQIATLDDGLRLVHVPLPGSGTVSLRFIVRGGGAHDPVEKSGLAHLLEHLVFHGTYDSEEGALFKEARTAGAMINAWTTPEWTAYMLDAPTDAFVPLASHYVKTVTAPALYWANLEREKAVVLAEQEVRNALAILWATDQLLFPADNAGRTVIGTEQTRSTITQNDLVSFYGKHYRTSNIIAVVTGDIRFEDAKALLHSSVLLPPRQALSEQPRWSKPNLGSEIKALSWTTATALGYAIDARASDATCHQAAKLVDFYVARAVRLEEPIAQHSEVVCHTSRGRRFLIAVAFGTNGLASQLPQVLESAFKAAQQPLSNKAKTVVLQRARAETAWLLSSPSDLATRLALAVGNPGGTLDARVKRVLAPPVMNLKKSRKLLKRSIKPSHRFLVHLSPFEG